MLVQGVHDVERKVTSLLEHLVHGPGKLYRQFPLGVHLAQEYVRDGYPPWVPGKYATRMAAAFSEHQVRM